MTGKMTTLAVVLAVVGINPLFAVPVEWPVSSGETGICTNLWLTPRLGISWTQARDAAAAKGGYLACITSAAENDFVFNNVVNDSAYWTNSHYGPWLGGYQYDKLAEPAGHWAWISGEPWNDTNWASPEPNNSGNGEDYLHYFSYGSSPAPTWNDEYQPGTFNVSYLIEYNAVPETFHVRSAGMGGIGLLAFSRRRAAGTAVPTHSRLPNAVR